MIAQLVALGIIPPSGGGTPTPTPTPTPSATVRLPFAVRPLDLGSMSTGNQRTERPVTHLNELKHIGMVWQTNGNATISAAGDFGSQKPVDFISVIAANAQPGTTIQVFLYSDAFSTVVFDSGPISFISPVITREDGLYNAHLELDTPVSARSWLFFITNHTGDFSASSVVIGKKLTPATYYNGDFERGTEDLGDLQLTPWGVPDETPGLIYRRLKVKFGWLDDVDWETKFRPLIEAVGKRGVVYFCFDPEPTAYRQGKTYLGWLRNPPYATGGVKPGKLESEFEILSMI